MELKAVRTDRLYVKVADQLLQLIAKDVIAVGARLPSERDLAEQLAVSRPTIREAMIALELSGVIEIRTGSGIYVLKKPAKLELLDQGIGPFEILEARLLVESQIAELAATRISLEAIAQLEALVDAMRHAQAQPFGEGSLAQSEALDWRFHAVIVEATQNSALVSVVNWLWELRVQSDMSQAFMARLTEQGVHPSLDEHAAIVAALKRGDAPAAKAAMRTHLENARAAAERYFEEK